MCNHTFWLFFFFDFLSDVDDDDNAAIGGTVGGLSCSGSAGVFLRSEVLFWLLVMTALALRSRDGDMVLSLLSMRVSHGIVLKMRCLPDWLATGQT